MRGPGAAAAADVGIVAAAAESPQVVDAAQTSKVDLWTGRPDLIEAHVANIASGETVGRERWAALDRAIRLEREHRMPGAATRPVDAFIAEPAPQVLVGSEVPDVVAHHHQQPTIHSFGIQAREQRHELGELIGLQQQMVVIRGISHRHGELDLPVFGAHLDDGVHQLREMRHGLRPDLRVDASPQAGSLGAPQQIERLCEGSGHTPDVVMQGLHAVERNADSLQSRLHRRSEPLGREVPAARLDGAIHPVRAYGADDLGPVPAQVGLAADQRDFARTQAREVLDYVEALGGG